MSDQAVLASRKYNLTAFLGDLGSLPFILLAGLMANAYFSGEGLHSASLLGVYVPYVFIAYSAVILSVLTGALWERSRLAKSSGFATAAILFSNLVALIAWACLLLIYGTPVMTIFAVSLLIAGFLSLLWVERLTDKTRSISQCSYWAMRLRITILVVLLHAFFAALMLAEL